MFSRRFHLTYFIIWTAALVCQTSGAPAAQMSMLDKFISEFGGCQMPEFVVLPTYKSDNDAVSNSAPDGNYDLSIPLEICTITPGKDDPAEPICNEAFDVIRNLSTCRKDIEELKKAIPPSKPINITAQVSTVCEDISADQNILAQKENYITFKLADKKICPMICKGEVSKACSFLLWGYKVQAQINDALRSKVQPNQDAAPNADLAHKKDAHDAVENADLPHKKDAHDAVENADLSHQKDYHDTVENGDPALIPQERPPVEMDTQKEKIQNHLESRDQETSKSSVTTENPPKNYQPSLGDHKTPQSKSQVPEVSKDIKEPQATKDELVKQQKLQEDKPKESVLPEGKPTDQRFVVSTTTAVAGKSASISLNGTPKNGKMVKNGDISDEHKEKSPLGVNVKLSTSTSTTSAESHKNTLANTEGTLQFEKLNKETEDNKLSDNTLYEIGKENKGTLQSDSIIPKSSDGDKPFPNDLNVPPGDQDTEEEIPPSNSAKNEDQNKDDPPSVSDKSKTDMPVKEASEKKLGPEDVAHEKTTATKEKTAATKEKTAATKEKTAASEKSVSEAMLDTSDFVGDNSQPADEDKEDNLADGQFDAENNDDSYNDNFGQPPGPNGNSFPDMNKADTDIVSNAEKLEHQENHDVSSVSGKSIISNAFPGQEDTHFFFYFVTIVIFAIGGYVLFHNKQKIFALIIEGRHERRRRSGASYRKLETK